MVEAQDDAVVLPLTALQRRHLGVDVSEAIVAAQRQRRQALANRALLDRMHVVVVADVARRHHPRVRLLERELRLRELHVIPRAAEWRELHEIELQPGIRKFFRPTVVERMHLRAVKRSIRPVVAALVPDEPAHCHRTPRRDHLVPENGRLLACVADRTLLVLVLPAFRIVHLVGGDFAQLVLPLVAAARRPRINAGAAPVAADNTDRDVKRAVKLQREVTTHRRKARRRHEIRRREPLPLDLVSGLRLRFRRPLVVRGVAEPDVRLHRHLRREPAEPVAEVRIVPHQRHLGVGLSRAIPHLADKDVLDLERRDRRVEDKAPLFLGHS